jgi:hypothetical protein
VKTYTWAAFTAEYYVARTELPSSVWSGVGYAQAVAQIARRWRAGLRFDFVDAPEGSLLQRDYTGTASIAFLPSEFSRLRLTAAYDSQPKMFSTIFQLEGTIGAHGAHPF